MLESINFMVNRLRSLLSSGHPGHLGHPCHLGHPGHLGHLGHYFMKSLLVTIPLFSTLQRMDGHH